MPKSRDRDIFSITAPRKRQTGHADVGDDFDNILGIYFANVRQFPLLSRAQEQEAWRRIEEACRRTRRALYMAPTALPALLGIWQQEETASSDAKKSIVPVLAQHPDLIEDLQRQAVALKGSGHMCRRDHADALRRWCKTWEVLDLHPQVYDGLRDALIAESNARPDDRRLQASYRIWRAADRRLTALKTAMIRRTFGLLSA